MFPDVLRELTTRLPGDLQIPAVTQLDPTPIAPVVQFLELPGGAVRDRPWNGPPLTDAYDLDVIVFSPADIPDAEGLARDRAHQVRDWLNMLDDSRFQIIARRPSRIGDYNSRLMRFQFTASVLARLITT